jgi:V8-like Glu-specific endopeptidase
LLPYDKSGRFLWISTGKITVSQTNLLFYNNDTSAGEIGGPVITNLNDDCQFCIVAINAYQRHGAGAHKQFNHGVRITRTVFNNLLNWRN